MVAQANGQHPRRGYAEPLTAPKVVIRAAARRDLVDHYRYLTSEADGEVADRFLVAANNSFVLLAGQPGLGPAISRPDPALKGLRKWRIADFENWLIFYQPRRNGVSIARVIHGSQDWWRLVGIA